MDTCTLGSRWIDNLVALHTESEVDCDEDKRRRLETLERHFSFPRSALMVQLNTARVGPAHLSAGPSYCAIRTPAADAKYQVFLDLRRRGFYLTSAGKFGGDFLVYPGMLVDCPLRCSNYYFPIHFFIF